MNQQIVITRKTLLQIAAGVSVVQGLIGVTLAYQLNKTIDQGLYLASIVQRNADHLDEFDLIALRDLGILKTPGSE
jgi:cell division protein YceG involved in septum cleavage